MFPIQASHGNLTNTCGSIPCACTDVMQIYHVPQCMLKMAISAAEEADLPGKVVVELTGHQEPVELRFNGKAHTFECYKQLVQVPRGT